MSTRQHQLCLTVITVCFLFIIWFLVSNKLNVEWTDDDPRVASNARLEQTYQAALRYFSKFGVPPRDESQLSLFLKAEGISVDLIRSTKIRVVTMTDTSVVMIVVSEFSSEDGSFYIIKHASGSCEGHLSKEEAHVIIESPQSTRCTEIVSREIAAKMIEHRKASGDNS